MKLRILSSASCLLLFAGVLAAQSRTADPLSGAWSGYMGRTEQERQPINVTLKFDGKVVTGTITGPPHPGDITKGSFDAATGALEFEVTVQDDAKTAVLFEGKVVKGNATGTVAFDGRKGIFNITRKVADPSATAPATKPAKRTPEEIQAAFEAHKGDFDYLLGDWEYTAESKEHGKFRGYWSAVRLDEGQVLDEYRVVGDKDETYYVTTTLRNYNKMMDRWELVGADAGTGLQDFGTGRRVGPEIHIEQKFGVAAGNPSVWRIRYFNIKADSFSWTADRSTDGGKTWVKGFQQIEARRIGPARSLPALAPARKAG